MREKINFYVYILAAKACGILKTNRQSGIILSTQKRWSSSSENDNKNTSWGVNHTVFIAGTTEVANVSKMRSEREGKISREKNLPKILSCIINTARQNISKKFFGNI